MNKEVTIKFRTKAAAKEFISWMDGQGEQDMEIWWDEAQYQGRQVGSTCFDYDYENGVITQRKEVKDADS